MQEDIHPIPSLDLESESLHQQLAEARAALAAIRRDEAEALQRLRAAQAASEAARRGQTLFLAALGHELRNPLAPIRNSVALMRRAGSSDPIIQRAQEIIDRQVAHMTRLVEDLLDVSRISTGRIVLNKEELDLTERVAAVVEEYLPVMEGNGVALDYQPPAGPVRVFADAARMTQMLSHLLDNANQHTDRGGRVKVGLRLDPGGLAVISVRDQGTGMAPEILERLFEPFVQDETGLGRTHGGLGLGLALVKGLITLHGGTVSAWSDGPGRGSEFTLRLPALRTATPAQPGLPAAVPPRSNRPRRILIVEDLLDTAITMELLLEMLGHEVEIAADGKAGLEKANRFEPEIVLCDIGLPGQMNGYEVARAIRGSSRLKNAYLIALTGFGTPEDQARARLAGFDLHLTKPLDPATLEPLIARIPVA
jgi:signal transduction histidine kinase